ncbi:3'-5' exoribonuclease domain-containing protein [Nonomuraea jabiensis]|uniref:3'-5' exoribonuclease domain-containing protein n=1 Tax=Nonomuraea jabiensis TaxID=882448 RepID=UPI003D71D4EB
MRIYYDTEFYENGRTIDLISIGMVAEDGRSFYGITSNLPFHALYTHEFLRSNVTPYLPVRQGVDDYSDGDLDFQHQDIDKVLYPTDLAQAVSEFIAETPEPELWAYYGAYDHVALAQLFGPMVKMPKHIPWFTNDLKQEIARLGNPTIPVQDEGHHNALADARWNKAVGDFLLGAY